jgi:hypothetical protein
MALFCAQLLLCMDLRFHFHHQASRPGNLAQLEDLQDDRLASVLGHLPLVLFSHELIYTLLQHGWEQKASLNSSCNLKAQEKSLQMGLTHYHVRQFHWRSQLHVLTRPPFSRVHNTMM